MRQISDKINHINVTGYCFWAYEDNQQPVLAKLESALFLQLFSTQEKAEAALVRLFPLSFFSPSPGGFVKIDGRSLRLKKIIDHQEFLDSVKGQIRVMVDPYVVNGKTRFVELQDGANLN